MLHKLSPTNFGVLALGWCRCTPPPASGYEYEKDRQQRGIDVYYRSGICQTESNGRHSSMQAHRTQPRGEEDVLK